MPPTPPPHEGEVLVMIYYSNTTLSEGEGRPRISFVFSRQTREKCTCLFCTNCRIYNVVGRPECS